MTSFLKRIGQAWRQMIGDKSKRVSASSLQRKNLQSLGQQRSQISPDAIPAMAEEHRKRTLLRDRLNEDTIARLERSIAVIKNQVLTALNPSCEPELRDFTLYTLVTYVICDWKDNGNATGLDPDDVADLRSFIQLATALSEHNSKLELAVYRPVLNGLMDDWFDNWNANGRSGPA